MLIRAAESSSAGETRERRGRRTTGTCNPPALPGPDPRRGAPRRGVRRRRAERAGTCVGLMSGSALSHATRVPAPGSLSRPPAGTLDRKPGGPALSARRNRSPKGDSRRSGRESRLAIRDIVKYGDPRLVARNAPLLDFTDPSLLQLIEDLKQTCWAAPGLGLAAPQIGVNLRIAIVDLSVGKDPSQVLVLVNPVVVDTQGSIRDEEGCLSLPGPRRDGRTAREGDRRGLRRAWKEADTRRAGSSRPGVLPRDRPPRPASVRGPALVPEEGSRPEEGPQAPEDRAPGRSGPGLRAHLVEDLDALRSARPKCAAKSSRCSSS